MFTVSRDLLRALLIGSVTLGLSVNARAANIVDNFEDSIIDSTKWNAFPAWTAATRFEDSAVEETGGELRLQNRGYLVTRDQFDPAAGLVITGRGVFPVLPPLAPPLSGGDWFQIAIRSDGTPDLVPASSKWGEVQYGIECLFIADRDQPNWTLQMWEHNAGVRARGLGGVSIPAFGIGVPFGFRITDDGSNVTFSAWDERNPDNVYTVAGTSDYRSPGGVNYVAFYNREVGKNRPYDHVFALEEIAIVPEHATNVLAILGLATVLCARRVRSMML